MRILHTADWHLGDRLGGVDRTADIRLAVETVAACCKEHRVDVCLIAGDIFSDRHPRDEIQNSIRHLATTFEEFLLNGGTVLAVTGNHDNELFCQTMKQMMRLSAPAPICRGDVVANGRWYLGTGPTFLRLRGPGDEEVQFVLMPYPTVSRYASTQDLQISSILEKHRALHQSFLGGLKELQASRRYSPTIPTVLAAHVFVEGATLTQRFRISEQDDVVFRVGELPSTCSYVALGHLHRPQSIGGVAHIRYAGSIERLDMGEREDSKQVVLVELGRKGQLEQLTLLPIAATPFYDIRITDPQRELPQLSHRYPQASRALVRYHIAFRAGRDNLNEILSEMNRVFPRWYDRTWTTASERNPTKHVEHTVHDISGHVMSQPFAISFNDSVMEYLRRELTHHVHRDGVLNLAERLLVEESV